MPPREDEIDHLFGDLAFPPEHAQDLVLKELFKVVRVTWRNDLERAAIEETAIGTKNMAMGVEVEVVAKGLYGYDCAGCCGRIRQSHTAQRLQRFPHAVTQFE